MCSLPQEDSEKDDDVATSSRRTSSRRTAASLLSCLRKQKSDQDPLMRRLALPLRVAQAQVDCRLSLRDGWSQSQTGTCPASSAEHLIILVLFCYLKFNVISVDSSCRPVPPVAVVMWPMEGLHAREKLIPRWVWPLTLTYNLNIQSQLTYGHDAPDIKLNLTGRSFQKRSETNGRSDGRTDGRYRWLYLPG